MKHGRRFLDRMAFALMLVSFVSSGIIYGIFATVHGWVPMPQIRAAKDAFEALEAELGRHPTVDVPGRRPQIRTPAPDRLAPGLLMVVGVTDGPRNFIRIIDRSGQVIHAWHPDWFRIWGDAGDFPAERRPRTQPGAVLHGVALAENGDVVFNFDNLSTVRLSPCGEVVWKLENLGHHSVHIDEDGTIWVAAHEVYHADPPFQNHGAPLVSSTIQKIAPNGEILDSIEVLDVLRKNDLLGLMHMSTIDERETVVVGDTMHLNDVETYPRDGDSAVFAPGDVMLSLRNIATVLVMDPVTHRIKFRSTGRVLRQHDPDFIGGDAILVFDNRNLAPSTGPEAPVSRIVEIDARSGKHSVRFQGEGDAAFFTDIMGKHAYLENGNLLVTSAREGRVIEVAPNGALVWEYNNAVAGGRNGWVSEAEALPPQMDERYFERLSAKCSAER